MSLGLDEYSRNARLKPALLTVVPAAWTVMAWAPVERWGWSGLWGVFVAAGGTLLVAHMGRDLGKRKERALHDRFGGRPSERLLSHEHAPNKVRLNQRHSKLRGLMPDVPIPTADEETRDPAKAHATYNACVDYLVALTRDNQLLFQENMNYGFRRNLWGLKPFGVAVAGCAVAALGFRIYQLFSTNSTIAGLMVFEAFNILMLAAWIFWFTPAWVMIPSRAYAERLLEALDTL